MVVHRLALDEGVPAEADVVENLEHIVGFVVQIAVVVVFQQQPAAVGFLDFHHRFGLVEGEAVGAHFPAHGPCVPWVVFKLSCLEK